jgi:hypothetical protein
MNMNLEKNNISQDINDNIAKRKLILEDSRIHWAENGNLGVTADDHYAIGSSPDMELCQNHGKTLGELWDIEKICEKIKDTINFLEKARKKYEIKYEKDPRYPDNRWYRDDVIYGKEELKRMLRYLRSIGKLPEEFENYSVKDLRSDPS